MYDIRHDSHVPDYIDGNLAGGNGYEWEGTVDLSRSRHISPIGVIRHLKIKNTHGSQVLYVALDAVAEESTSAIKLSAGETYETSHPIDFRKNVSIIASAGSTTYEGVVFGIHTPIG